MKIFLYDFFGDEKHGPFIIFSLKRFGIVLIITVPSLVKTRLVWLVKKVRTAYFVMASVNQPGKFH